MYGIPSNAGSVPGRKVREIRRLRELLHYGAQLLHAAS